MQLLGHLSAAEFLRDYWQKKPLLIRNAIPDFEPLLSAEELAGLSLEEEIESRLILEEGKTGPWELRKGPFTEDDYRQLPDKKWTLLVQSVDQWLPEAADLLGLFDFLPSWRIDDLMISYAVDGGSVGPHFDQYDVFLLQAEGQREWRTGQRCNADSALIKGTSLSILADFKEDERWTLNPGDMLYLPPGLAHHGIARGNCQTYSIGFRAPSAAQLVERAADAILSGLTEHQRYADADLHEQEAGGEISPAAVQRLKTLLTEQLNRDDLLSRVLGELMTEPRNSPEPDDPQTPDWSELCEALSYTDTLYRHEQARFAFSRHSGHIEMYVQGEAQILPDSDLALVTALCGSRTMSSSQIMLLARSQTAQQLLCDLYGRHLIYAEGDDDGSPDY